MDDYMSIANSPLMFVLCGIVIIYVVAQSFIFMRRAWKRGIEIGMEPAVLKKTITSSAIFSVVPCIPIIIILVMLMSVLGNYFPWLRLSVIGSSGYENIAANVTATSFELKDYTDPGFNSTIFIGAMWAMTICIMYEPLLVVFGYKSLDKGLGKIRDTKPVLFSLLLNGLFIALMGWFCAPHLTSWLEDSSGILALLALIGAAISAMGFLALGKKTGKAFFRDMSFPGGMLIGMACAFFGNMIFLQ